MTANEHFDRIFSNNLNNSMNRIMFVAGYEAALNELMNRAKSGTAFNLALALYSERVQEDLDKIREKNAKATNNATEDSV